MDSPDMPYRIQNITTGWVAAPRFCEGLLLINMCNFYERGRFLLPTTRRGDKHTFKFTQWANYFYTEVKRQPLPFHFYTERFTDDWIILNGSNFGMRSWFLEDLIKHRIIEDKYRDYNVIGISHDTTMSAYPDRCMMLLSDRILSYYERYHNLNFDTSIRFFDEILTRDWATRLEKSDLRYVIEPDKITDHKGNRIAMKRYAK